MQVPVVRRRSRTVALLAFLATVALVAPDSYASAADSYPVTSTGLAITGHGYGHGHGMGQYGAQGAALRGVGYRDILAHYYPGTTLGPMPAPTTIRVLISEDTDNDLTVRAEAGLAVAEPGGGRWVLPAGPTAWRISADPSAGQHLEQLVGSWQPWSAPDGRPAFYQLRFEGPARIRLELPGGGGRAYRGSLTAARAGGSALQTVDTVGVEQYLWGVVPRESPSSWQPDALKAQAVAARSYAAYKRAAGGSAYDICSTTACQVYGGSASYGSSGGVTEQEPASSTAAVEATAGEVLLYAGRPAFTEFSSSTGGWNAAGGVPYLAAGPDPWDDYPGNPVHTWRATLGLAALQSAYPTVGAIQSVQVTGRDGNGEWGGRITTILITGTASSVTTTGSQFAGRLGLRSQWWAVTQPAILTHWQQFGGAAGWLGDALGAEYDVPGGRAQDFRNGRIFWSAATGAAESHGLILVHYLAIGGPAALGLPWTDERVTPDGLGRYNHFTDSSIYWTPATGAQLVLGAIRGTWARLGWEQGALGYPLTDELPTPDGIGRYNHFQSGSVYWTPTTGARQVIGDIQRTWAALGWEVGPLGYPLTDELPTPDGIGRYNHFQSGSVYWTPTTRAHEVRGDIERTWAGLGWERSALGYPTSNEYDVPGGRRGDFQGGTLTWNAASRVVTLG